MFDQTNAEVLVRLDKELGISPAQFKIPRAKVERWDVVAPGIFQRLRFHSKLPWPHLPELEEHPGKCIIVGSAPSVAEHLEQIKALKVGEYDIICSLNGTHGFLNKHGIIPNIHVIFEIDVRDLSIIGSQPNEGTRYYVCSHCPMEVAEALKGQKCVLWHCFNEPPDYQAKIAEYFPGEFMVGGGHATFFRTMNIAVILGYREFEIFGCDSSFGEGSTHLDDYPTPTCEDAVEVWGYDPRIQGVKKFRTIGSLALQASEFIRFCEVNHAGLSIRVHGDSLLRYLHESRYPEQYHERT